MERPSDEGLTNLVEFTVAPEAAPGQPILANGEPQGSAAPPAPAPTPPAAPRTRRIIGRLQWAS